MLERIRAKLATQDSTRLTREEGEWLLDHARLLDLAELAQRERFRRYPRPEVTFVVDTNPNYTNICDVDCHFCAFYRHADAHDAYLHDTDGVMEMIERALDAGATTVLLQGGVHPSLPLSYYTGLVRACRERFPEITPHFYSAPEIRGMAEVSGLSNKDVLQALYDAGQRTLPGGGAEVLSDRVKRKISHKKGTSQDWLDVHRAAHQVGMRSTATMMYGHLDHTADVIEHLDVIRALQDETGGFTAFIPWSFKPSNTVLDRAVPTPAPPTRYLRILAIARLYLDNFEHIQASWFSEGKRLGQVALHWGADDFGGTILEENVHAATGHHNKATAAEEVTLIHEAGFDAVQRTTLYEHVRCYPRPQHRGEPAPAPVAGPQAEKLQRALEPVAAGWVE
jgi:cyclic dehypoxanthinyl futalosine synthase